MAFFEMEYEYRVVAYEDARDITDFLNRRNIAQEDIVAILTQNKLYHGQEHIVIYKRRKEQ